MERVQLEIAPAPKFVRTARLVAVASARQQGVPPSLLDEIRMAVGEACTRAVRSHQRASIESPILMECRHDGTASAPERFIVSVSDTAPVTTTWKPESTRAMLEENPHFSDDFASGSDEMASAVELTVITQITTEVRIEETDAGTTLCMFWDL